MPEARLVPCPTCGREVATTAKACPQCGRPDPGREEREVDLEVERLNAPPPPRPKMAAKDKAQVVQVLLAVALFVGVCSLCNRGSDRTASSASSTSADWRTADNSTTACIRSERAVKAYLRSPGTAEFPGMFEGCPSVSPLGGGRYQVRSWVDSQNGFGAVVRSTYTATMVQTGPSDWHAESVVVQ
jgi:hypothetical protein